MISAIIWNGIDKTMYLKDILKQSSFFMICSTVADYFFFLKNEHVTL